MSLGRATPAIITGLTLVISGLILRDNGLEYWGRLSFYIAMFSILGNLSSLRTENVHIALGAPDYLISVLFYGTANLLVVVAVIHWLFDTRNLLDFLIPAAAVQATNNVQAYNVGCGKKNNYYFFLSLYSLIPFVQIYFLNLKVDNIWCAYILSLIISIVATTFYGFNDKMILFGPVELCRKTYKQILFSFPQTVVNQIRTRLIYVLLPSVLDFQSIGAFNLIDRVSGTIATLYGNTFRPIFLSSYTRAGRIGREELKVSIQFAGFVLALGVLAALSGDVHIDGFDLTLDLMVSGLFLMFSSGLFKWADKIYEVRNKQHWLFFIELSSGIIFFLPLVLVQDITVELLIFSSILCFSIYNFATMIFLKHWLLYCFCSLGVLWILARSM